MGKKVSLMSFCESKVVDKERFVRGYLDPKRNKVVCQTANQVNLSFTCKKKNKSICNKPKKLCGILKPVMAKNHNIYKAFSNFSDKKIKTHCLYQSSLQRNELSSSIW